MNNRNTHGLGELETALSPEVTSTVSAVPIEIPAGVLWKLMERF